MKRKTQERSAVSNFVTSMFEAFFPRQITTIETKKNKRQRERYYNSVHSDN